MADPRVFADLRVVLIDALLDGVDDIEGTDISIDDNADHNIWIHTSEQVRSWLIEERAILLRIVEQELAAAPADLEEKESPRG